MFVMQCNAMQRNGMEWNSKVWHGIMVCFFCLICILWNHTIISSKHNTYVPGTRGTQYSIIEYNLVQDNVIE